MSEPAPAILEVVARPRSGLPPLLFEMPLLIASGIAILILTPENASKLLALPCFITAFFWPFGLIAVAPNEARVIQLFGHYRGTVHNSGLFWVHPFATKRKVSVRVRNFDCDKLKVNDHKGNPIEIGAVVVWKVVDTAEAVFEVDDFEHYVEVQTEAALRNLATQYPYDSHDEDENKATIALRSHPQEIAEQLKREVQARLSKAGVEVIEARISHLAYAQEIASAMLQRQQADAIIAARRKIVDGAVGMVEMALADLSRKNVVQLDDERKASMVQNLLVVLCSNSNAQPVINAGSLYS